MKIVLAGPPQSGKSCLREGLKQAILGLQRNNSDIPYPYVITACPDGEGAWFQETTKKYPEVAKACKEAYKGKFTPKFVKLVAKHVRKCKQTLTMVDIGGLISKENKKICKGATHIVILAGNDSESGECWDVRIAEWRGFAKALDLTVVAEIFSDYHSKADVVENVGSDNILRGSVHYLKRGVDIVDRPMVQALARHILTIAGYPLTGEPSAESSTYIITRDKNGILRVGFGTPGDNTQIVKDAAVRLDAMEEAGELSGGDLLKINGPASLPVAMFLGHRLSDLFEVIACFDPRMDQYVIAISRSSDSKYAVGNVID